MKRTAIAAMCVSLICSVASGGTITVSTDAPTGVFASGSVDGPNFTRVFADGARPTDDNEGRGNEIVATSGSYAGYSMDALVIRKDANQDFTGTTAFLTLYVFEGTKEMWDAGDGQGDGDLWDETGITTIYTETFSLDGSYVEADYVGLNLDTPVTMASEMNFFIKMTQGDSAETYFQIVQRNNPPAAVTAADGYQYQSVTNDNKYVISPLEYYAVGRPPADTNGDGVVDATDYMALKRNMGSGPGADEEDGDVADGSGASGQDGYVNLLDLDLMAGALNPSAGGGTVPEPGSAFLLLAGAGWLLRRRKAKA